MAQNTRNLIFSIYAHLLLAISVLVVAVGTYMLINNLTGRFLMSQYPIGYEENRCDYITTNKAYPAVAIDGSGLTPEQMETNRVRLEEESARAEQDCRQETERLRQRKMQTDLANAINTLFVGLLLLVPHAIIVRRLNSHE